MDRQSTFLLALGLLIVAAAMVSVAGWVLFVRDRGADRGGSGPGQPEPETAAEGADPAPDG